MLLPTLLAAAMLPLTAVTSQIPIIEKKDKLSKVISDSPFLSLHRTLCEINSITNEENKISLWVEKFLEKHHFKVITQEIPPYPNKPPSKKPRLNIYAYPDPKHYKSHSNDIAINKKKPHLTTPKVLLTSHIDTVPPFFPYGLAYNSTSPTFNRSDILIRGRGTVDDKACVAVQITAAMEFLSTPKVSASDLALLFVVDEETGGEGMRHFSNSTLYQDIQPDLKAILFGEPTERKLVAGHKGIFMLQLHAQGKAAHSGYPWLGRSANSMILPALNVLDRLQYIPEAQGGLPGSEKFGNTTINVGFMQGGVAANVVPESARASIAFRLAAGTAEENQEIVARVLSEVDPDGLLEYEFTQGYGPVEMDVDVPGFESMVVNYGTDIPGLDVKEGVKRYLYGPGSIFVAHGADESLTVGELEAGLEGYRRLIAHALAL